VFSEHVNELEANRITECLGDRRHPLRLAALDVGVDDRLAARLTAGRFCFGASSNRRASIYVYRLK